MPGKEVVKTVLLVGKVSFLFRLRACTGGLGSDEDYYFSDVHFRQEKPTSGVGNLLGCVCLWWLTWDALDRTLDIAQYTGYYSISAA